MSAPLPHDPPTHSIALRKAFMLAFAALSLAGFVPALLQYKGLINVEDFGIPETPFYVAGFAAAFVGIVATLVAWRCPGCGAYLGKEISPAQCSKCGAKFS